MQPDLIGLEITKGELRRLTGVNPNNVLRTAMMQNREQRFAFFMQEVRTNLLLILLIGGLIYALLVFTVNPSITLGIALLVAVSIAVVIGRWLWRSLIYPQQLKILLNQVDRYHAVIQRVDHTDQLRLSEQGEINLNTRETAIASLQLLREDLVRALKIERLLRDNKELLANNQELFVNNLTALQALQASNQADEYTQFLNQSLQIDLDVQALVGKLQSSRR